MTDKKLHRLVLAALFTALTTVMTMVIQVPSPMQGYVNLGDCGVLLSAWVLGPAWGGAAAGVGSMLADLLSGYAHYAPGTLVIKTCMAVAAALILRAFQRGDRPSLAGQLAGGAAAGTILVAGYFGYACLLLGKGLAAAASIPGNIVQAVFGLAAAVAVMQVLIRSGSLARARNAWSHFSIIAQSPGPFPGPGLSDCFIVVWGGQKGHSPRHFENCTALMEMCISSIAS